MQVLRFWVLGGIRNAFWHALTLYTIYDIHYHMPYYNAYTWATQMVNKLTISATT